MATRASGLERQVRRGALSSLDTEHPRDLSRLQDAIRLRNPQSRICRSGTAFGFPVGTLPPLFSGVEAREPERMAVAKPPIHLPYLGVSRSYTSRDIITMIRESFEDVFPISITQRDIIENLIEVGLLEKTTNKSLRITDSLRRLLRLSDEQRKRLKIDIIVPYVFRNRDMLAPPVTFQEALVHVQRLIVEINRNLSHPLTEEIDTIACMRELLRRKEGIVAIREILGDYPELTDETIREELQRTGLLREFDPHHPVMVTTSLAPLMRLTQEQRRSFNRDIIRRYSFGISPFDPSHSFDLGNALTQLQRLIQEMDYEDRHAAKINHSVEMFEALLKEPGFQREFQEVALKMCEVAIEKIRKHMLICRVKGSQKGAYHNTAHALEFALDILTNRLGASDTAVRLLAYSMALYHDVVQDQLPPENEEKSAEEFVKDFRMMVHPLLVSMYRNASEVEADLMHGLTHMAHLIIVGGTYLDNTTVAPRLMLDRARAIMGKENPVHPQVVALAREFTLYDIHRFMMTGSFYEDQMKRVVEAKLPDHSMDDLYRVFDPQNEELRWMGKLSQSLRMNLFEFYKTKTAQDEKGKSIPFLDAKLLPKVRNIMNKKDKKGETDTEGITPDERMRQLTALVERNYTFGGTCMPLYKRVVACAKMDHFHHTRFPFMCGTEGEVAEYVRKIESHHAKIDAIVGTTEAPADESLQKRFAVLLLLLSTYPEGDFLRERPEMFRDRIEGLVRTSQK